MTISDKLLEIDGNIMIGIQHALDADWFTAVMKGVTFLSECGWFWILICLLLIVSTKTRRVGIICAASLLLAFILCNGVIKPSIDRARPWEIIDGVKMLIPDPGDSSFPSGHATSAMATSWALWLATLGKQERPDKNFAWLHRLSYIAIGIAILTALSRVVLGMHFPSDVMGGMLIGVMSAYIIHKIYKKKTSKDVNINASHQNGE